MTTQSTTDTANVPHTKALRDLVDVVAIGNHQGACPGCGHRLDAHLWMQRGHIGQPQTVETYFGCEICPCTEDDLI